MALTRIRARCVGDERVFMGGSELDGEGGGEGNERGR